MKTARGLLSLAAFALALSMVGGCYADADFPPDVTDDYEGEDDYQPMTYDGYVVYYDAFARPFCFIGGRVWFVPTTYPYYDALVAHYYRYRAFYPAWSARHGYYGYRGFYGYHGADGYHGYRGYHGYHGYPSYHGDGGAHVHPAHR